MPRTEGRASDGDDECARIWSQMTRQRAAVETLVPPNLSTTHDEDDEDDEEDIDVGNDLELFEDGYKLWCRTFVGHVSGRVRRRRTE